MGRGAASLPNPPRPCSLTVSRSFQPLDALLGRLIKDPRLLATGGRVARLREAWVEVVGAPVAAHTEASHLQGRALVVYVEDGGWLTELNFRRGELLERIHAWAGEPWPEELRLTLHALEAEAGPTPAATPPPAPSGAMRQAAREAAAEVEDEELRQVIERALARQRRGGH